MSQRSDIPAGSDPIRLVIRPRRACGWLASGATVLILLHVAVMTWHFLYERGLHPTLDPDDEPRLGYWQRMFDLDEEQGFGTWFSSGLLMLAGLLSWLAARHRRAAVRDQIQPPAAGPDPDRRCWWLLAAGFTLLSADEVAGVHESFNSVTDFSWAIPGGILALLVGILFLPFLSRLPRRTAVLVLLGGMIFVGGAVGVELATKESDTLEYNLLNAVEEGMEMFGVILYVYAALEHLAGGAGIGVSIGRLQQEPRGPS